MKFLPSILGFHSRSPRSQMRQHLKRDYDGGNLFFPRARVKNDPKYLKQSAHIMQSRIITIFPHINQKDFIKHNARNLKTAFSPIETFPLDIDGVDKWANY